MGLMKNGSSGGDVTDLQTKLTKLGFKLEVDGKFGKNTEDAVRHLQKLFGYTVDGIVGDGTKGLVDAQLGYGWNVNQPDAAAKAAAAGASKG